MSENQPQNETSDSDPKKPLDVGIIRSSVSNKYA